MALEERAVRSAPDSHAVAEDHRLLEAMRNGNEGAFIALVERYQAPLARLAMVYVGDPAVAEEVVQETWIGVLRGVERFEGRAAFKTWLFRILTNQAKRRGAREGRSVSFSSLSRRDAEGDERAVAPECFLPADDPDAGHWAGQLQDWKRSPEDDVLSQEVRSLVGREIEGLPPGQRMVIALRDVEGWGAAEVCGALGISETNQRVLLHRARSKVRRALDCYLGGT
jgi:RNA polymerase sigma-70 factor (ECF subfamily)